jgi:hypothetical protein
MTTVFGISFTSSKDQSRDNTASQKQAKHSGGPGRMPIVNIKQYMTQSMQDVTGIEAERLQYAIRAARNVNDLWLLRCSLYQSISKQYSQSEAALRINALLPYFKNWLPKHQLSRV